jgi:mandelate racemase
VSCHLLAVTPTCHWLEFVDWADAILQEPLAVKDGFVTVPEKPMLWNEEAVRRYQL